MDINTTKIAIFKGKGIRKTIYQNEWWFSVVDVIEVLTGTDRARKYWSDLKKKIVTEGYSELSDKIVQLNLFKHLSDYCLAERDLASPEILKQPACRFTLTSARQGSG